MFPELPHDVVINILARLHAKTLLLFKTVCSLWCRTIESPHFATLQACSYCSSHESEEKVLIDSTTNCYSVADVNTLSVRKIVPAFELPLQKTGLAVYSSNGVLLLVDSWNSRMVLWNPATGKYKDIPPDSVSYMYSYFCGLWYNCCNEFRVLSIRHGQEVLVLDSNSNSWKTVDTLPHNLCVDENQWRSKAFIHGGFHMAAFDSDEKQRRILSFSPEGKVIKDFQPPSDWNKLSKDSFTFSLTTKVWAGRLCLQALARIWTPSASSYHFEYWNMEEYGSSESWKKVSSLENRGYCLHSLQQNGRQLWVSYSDLTDICVKDGDSDEMKSMTSSSESMFFAGTYAYTPTLLSP